MSDFLPVVQKAQPDLLEELASLEHDQWCEWTERLSQFENITQERLVRWNALRVPYDELPERQKEQDRVYARRVLAIIERERAGYEKREQQLKNKIKRIAIHGMPCVGEGGWGGDNCRICVSAKELLELSKQ